MTGAGSFVLSGNGPKRFETAEVVHAKQVQMFEGETETVDPPAEIVLRDAVPAIGWAAPPLAVSAEIIGRDAADRTHVVILVQIEKCWMAPYVGAVVFDVKRQIAENRNVPLAAIFPELPPLAKKFELQKRMITRCFRGRFSALVERVPGLAAIRVEQSHEVRIRLQPPGVVRDKILIFLRFGKGQERSAQQSPFVTRDRRISDLRRGKARYATQVF